MRGVFAVLVSFAQAHVRGRDAEHARFQALGTLDNGAERSTRGARPGEAMAIAVVVQEHDGLGRMPGRGAVQSVQLSFEVAVGDRARSRRGRW